MFERSVYGGTPRRLVQIPHTTLKADADYDDTYYRFSPEGDKLAWYTDEGFYVLDLSTGVVRTLYAAYPGSARGGLVSELYETKCIGFDWRDDEALVIQRGAELELVTIRRLRQ
ncbi:MAG: hypothetical protein NZ874_04915 [Fimbriimonadales bacterium]|nr:hypothetical protein [Fimbriimonadales bacterium]